jgi:uroporphyrinogen decarboxylase
VHRALAGFRQVGVSAANPDLQYGVSSTGDTVTTLKNDRLLRALRLEPVDATPVWIMRQAGRYLPEYRATRERAGDFLTLCKTPELACEVTLQPIDRFPLDAAILFSDILTIPDAMGLGLSLVEGEGPRFARRVQSSADVAALGVPDPETDLKYVMDAVRLIRREIDGRVPLIGFAGSPWTLATYMVEGGPTRDFHRIKGMLYGAPDVLHRLLQLLAESVASYLEAQVAAGAQVLMLFDTWGGVLARTPYLQFSLEYMRHIAARIAGRAPLIVFSKGATAIEEIAACGCQGVGVDWTVDLGDIRRRTGGRIALQGNLDPAVLAAPPEVIRREAKVVLDSFGPGPGHIFNLGHGIEPHIDPEHVRVLVEAVHEMSAGGKS